VVAVAAGEAHTLLLVGNSSAAPYSVHPVKSGQLFSLLVQTYAGKMYALEYKPSLSAANWTTLPPIRGNGAMQFLVDPAANSTQRFYRVRVW
jgi:hypothetical protein